MLRYRSRYEQKKEKLSKKRLAFSAVVCYTVVRGNLNSQFLNLVPNTINCVESVKLSNEKCGTQSVPIRRLRFEVDWESPVWKRFKQFVSTLLFIQQVCLAELYLWTTQIAHHQCTTAGVPPAEMSLPCRGNRKAGMSRPVAVLELPSLTWYYGEVRKGEMTWSLRRRRLQPRKRL